MTGKQRRPPRSVLYGLALACAGLTCVPVNAQVLKQRFPGRTECPDTHLRLTARHADGSPAAGLRPQDIYLWFSTGTADIRSMQSGGVPDTNLLIVIRPGGAVSPDATDAVIRNLRAENLHWQVGVLAPDGSLSQFIALKDEGSLRNALLKATTPVPNPLEIDKWSAAERSAFQKLQIRAGRHVILELTEPAMTVEDHTLDLLARDDMAQIYRLTADAKEQFEATGGRAAPTLDALFHGMIADAPGSYDLAIHPRFSCQPGASYSLRITSFRPDVQLFYPGAVRMATAGAR